MPLTRSIARLIERHLPQAALEDRDPEFIQRMLPGQWLLASLWFRADVRALDRIPPHGPVLLVGNHSGGNMTPDTLVFTLAFCAHFGADRPFYQLAHNLVMMYPPLRFLRRYGTVAASEENAEKALRSGAAVLVYPGGDQEVHRPSWRSARIDFAGHKGFVRLALAMDIPIVPVVSIGGQETALFLTSGDRLAHAMRLDKMLRLKVFPVSLALPWGVNVGDFLGHLPLPAKISIRVLEPIDLRKRFGPAPDVDAVCRYITDVMQRCLDELSAARKLPVLG